jgi:transposase
MTPLPDLSTLSHAAKDALILALWQQAEALSEQVQALRNEVAELRARLGEPPKSSSNSSQPPSRDRKANKPPRSPGLRREASVGRAGGGRPLHPDPDRIVEARAKQCPHCAGGLEAAAQQPVAVYDRIELPPVRPVVTRVVLHAARCPCCAALVRAPAPVGLEPGSPYGASIAATAVYLRYSHAIGYRRLSGLFDHLFGLQISEGALVNLFQRVKPCFDGQVADILVRLRRSRLVCSDETSARVHGRNQWEWVFQNEQVAVHVIRPSRGRAVVEEVLAGHRPEIWVSDLYGAQRGHADRWQLCLAHQLRDCKFAIEAGDAVFAPPLKRLILRAVAIGRRRARLSDATLRQYHQALERRMDAVMACQPSNRHGIRLRKRFGSLRVHLFTFITEREAPATNNGSERALRPSVIFRKVTNGFRSEWGRDLYAAVRSVIGTGQRAKLSPFQAIQNALADQPVGGIDPLPG